MKYCNQCGAPNPDSSAFCAACGMPLAAPQEAAASPAPPAPNAPGTPQPAAPPQDIPAAATIPQAPAMPPPPAYPAPQPGAGAPPQAAYGTAPPAQPASPPPSPGAPSQQGYAPQAGAPQPPPPGPPYDMSPVGGAPSQPPPYPQGMAPMYGAPPPQPPKKKRSIWVWLAPVLIVVVLAGAFVAVWQLGLLDEWFGTAPPASSSSRDRDRDRDRSDADDSDDSAASSDNASAPAGSSATNAPASIPSSTPASSTPPPEATDENYFSGALAHYWNGQQSVAFIAEYETYKEQIAEAFDFSQENDFELAVWHSVDYDVEAIFSTFLSVLDAQDKDYELIIIFNMGPGADERREEMTAIANEYGVELVFVDF